MALYLWSDRFWTEVIQPKSCESFTQDNRLIQERLISEIKSLRQSIDKLQHPKKRKNVLVTLLSILLYFVFVALFLYLLFMTLLTIYSCPEIPKLAYLVILLFLFSSSRLAFIVFLLYMMFILFIGYRHCQNRIYHQVQTFSPSLATTYKKVGHVMSRKHQKK